MNGVEANKGTITLKVLCVWCHNRVVSGETPGRGEEEDVPSALQS